MYYVAEKYEVNTGDRCGTMEYQDQYDLTPCKTLDEVKTLLAKGPCRPKSELKLFQELDFNLEIILNLEILKKS